MQRAQAGLCAAALASVFGAVLEPNEAVPGGLGGTLPPRYGAAHKLLCLQPGAGSLAAFQTTRLRWSFSRAGEDFLASRGVQGDGSHHPDGSSTQPQPCTHCNSQQRVLHEQGPKMPQNTPFCLFPNLQLPQALLPPRLLEGCKDQALPDIPHSNFPWGGHVPATGSAGVNAPKFPFSSPT